MANITVFDRNSYERADLSEAGLVRNMTPFGRRVYAGLFFALVGILAALTYAAAEYFDGWPHLLVIADLFIVTYGISRWVYPKRKHI